MTFSFIQFHNEKQLFTDIGILNADKFLHGNFFLVKVTTLEMCVIFCFSYIIVFILHRSVVRLPFVAFIQIVNVNQSMSWPKLVYFMKYKIDYFFAIQSSNLSFWKCFIFISGKGDMASHECNVNNFVEFEILGKA